jgi:hypothetical protein
MFIRLNDGNIFEAVKVELQPSTTGINATFTSEHDNDNRVIPIDRVLSITKIHPFA